MSKIRLCSGVLIEYPDKYDIGEIQAVPWSQERRASEMKESKLSYMEKLCSDIYLIVDKSRNKTVLVFNQSDEASVTVSVRVSEDRDSGCTYEARVKNRSNWVTRVAEYTVKPFLFAKEAVLQFMWVCVCVGGGVLLN
jgi:hypothetical protein